MSKIDLRRIQRPLRERYQRDAEAARYTYRVRSSAAALDDPLHVEVASDAHGGASWRVSVNERVGGSGDELTPGDLILAALTSCQALSVKMVAANMGIELASLEVEAEGDVDHRGVMMLPGAQRVGFERVRCRVRLEFPSGTPPERIRALLQAAEYVCAVTDALRHATPLETVFEVEG